MNELIMPIVTGLIRQGVGAFGAYLATYGMTVSGTAQDQLVGAGLVVVSLGASAVQKWWAAQKARTAVVAAAKASVAAGTPVTVTVTPGDQPNIAVPIPAEEAASAPSVPAEQ